MRISALNNFNLRSSADSDVQSGERHVREMAILNEKHESMSEYFLSLQCEDYLTTPSREAKMVVE